MKEAKARKRRRFNMIKRTGIFLCLSLLICLFTSGYALAAEFGLVSETYVYPNGLRLNTDSKIQIWRDEWGNPLTLILSDDLNQKTEGRKSLKGEVNPPNQWLGFGIIWDPNLDNAPDPKNMSAYAGGSLKFWVKTQTPLKVGIKDHDSESWVILDMPSDNQWRFAAVPFSAFSGIDFSKITQFFMMLNSTTTSPGTTFHLDNIRWDTAQTGPLNSVTVTPASFTIPTGLPKGFKAQGYDSGGNTSDVHPTWTSTVVTGTFGQSPSYISVFTPSSTGSGTVRATYGGKTGIANIQVQDITWNDSFDIFVAEGLYGSLGTFDSDGNSVSDNSIGVKTIRTESLPGDNNTPIVGTVTPANGKSDAGVEVLIKSAFYDPDGYEDFSWGLMLMINQKEGTLHVDVYYNKVTNKLYLRNDDNTAWLGGYAPGASNTIENSYAVLNCVNTVVSYPSYDTMEVTWAITFKSSIMGNAYDIKVRSRDIPGLSTLLVKRGTWAVKNSPGVNNPPYVGLINPYTGEILVEDETIITSSYHDPDGYTDMAYGDLRVYSSGLRAWLRYSRGDNLLYLRNDGDTAWLGGFPPGSANAIESSYVSLNCANTQVEASGETINVAWALTFKEKASGKIHSFYLQTEDGGEQTNLMKESTVEIVTRGQAADTHSVLKVDYSVTDTGWAGIFFEEGEPVVLNPGMEMGDTTPTGWTTYNNDLTEEKGWVTDASHSPDHSIKIVNTTSANAGWNGPFMYFDTPYPKVVTLSGWVKSDNVSAGTANLGPDFRVDFSDSTYGWYMMQANKGTHDWEYVERIVNTGKSIKSVRAYCLLYGGTGTAWFDDINCAANQTKTRDLSDFAQGYLHFWIKTPVDLEIGLRSANITAGEEKSKIYLADYAIPADNNWHEVHIAIDDFKLWDARIDPAQATMFFSAAVIGERVGNSSGAFWISDVKYLRRKSATPILSVTIRKKSDDQTEPTGQIHWTTASLGGGWEIADQYLRVVYDNADPSWGAQVYTDNMGTGASPSYSGNPAQAIDQQPNGLLGVSEPLLTCPMTWMALDGTSANAPIPVEVQVGLNINFASDANGMWGVEKARSEWLWLKDVSSTVWSGDTNTNGIPDPAEIVSDFSLTGDEYSTFISPMGINTGWSNNDGSRVYILNPESPVVIYFAAKFKNAKVLQEYKTNTITVELYHY